jgi:hypothetical protein
LNWCSGCCSRSSWSSENSQNVYLMLVARSYSAKEREGVFVRGCSLSTRSWAWCNWGFEEKHCRTTEVLRRSQPNFSHTSPWMNHSTDLFHLILFQERFNFYCLKSPKTKFGLQNQFGYDQEFHIIYLFIRMTWNGKFYWTITQRK